MDICTTLNLFSMFDKKSKQLIMTYFETQPVLKAYLFGSYARNEATETSDIDLLIELDYSQPIGLEFVQMQFDLQKIKKKKVDLITERGLSKHIRPYIEAEKQLIYAK
jgi:predicted nucleotidyltransferase